MITKKFYNAVYAADHPSEYAGGDGPDRIAILQGRTKAWLKSSGLDDKADAQLLEIGCGMAFLSDIHPGWHGAEYSKTAVERVKNDNGEEVKIYEADAQQLPFKASAFDGIFSWATLEHVLAPELALEEIHRVLRLGGYGLIAPAWNCRPWTVKKLEDRPYNELSLSERFGKFLIPLRELLVIRAFIALPKRLWGEILLFTGGKQPLRYQTFHRDGIL